MKYLGTTDLINRWVYTPRGLRGLMKKADFPEPAHIINGGHTKMWSEEDIVEFELTHPEVLDREIKRFKVAAFAKWQFKKKAGLV